jgi:pyridoxamine 5'-phosphate oxidase family protein
MSVFTEAEVEYLNSQLIGRFATVGQSGAPHVMPVGVFYDPDAESLVITGHAGSNFAASRKFRNAQARPDVSFVVDDLPSTDPWTPRGLEIRGRAEIHTDGGEAVGERIGAQMPFDTAWILLRTRRILAWGIETESAELTARDVG